MPVDLLLLVMARSLAAPSLRRPRAASVELRLAVTVTVGTATMTVLETVDRPMRASMQEVIFMLVAGDV